MIVFEIMEIFQMGAPFPKNMANFSFVDQGRTQDFLKGEANLFIYSGQ